MNHWPGPRCYNGGKRVVASSTVACSRKFPRSLTRRPPSPFLAFPLSCLSCSHYCLRQSRSSPVNMRGISKEGTARASVRRMNEWRWKQDKGGSTQPHTGLCRVAPRQYPKQTQAHADNQCLSRQPPYHIHRTQGCS